MLLEAPAPAGASLDELKAYLRVTGTSEDIFLDRLLGAASGQCERFTGQALVRRNFDDMVPVEAGWTRLGQAPVSAITQVMGVPAEGAAFVLPVDAYAIDIDADGEGWVRIDRAGAAGRARVSYQAGLAGAAEWVPEPLRSGIVRLAAEAYWRREAGTGAAAGSTLPATVTALWRPWRRMRLGGGGVGVTAGRGARR